MCGDVNTSPADRHDVRLLKFKPPPQKTGRPRSSQRPTPAVQSAATSWFTIPVDQWLEGSYTIDVWVTPPVPSCKLWSRDWKVFETFRHPSNLFRVSGKKRRRQSGAFTTSGENPSEGQSVRGGNS